ncbi:MAG: HAMP domain-containing histidine kinase [Sterolibacteriaceae bacterium]|uniref:histidine kinase n=1 Tax=Candidatus Methylophosphatis roskildensis TaxID=2899263 RepID=A0A9D7DWE7_9PROT|nr:HAMP domain-containing histidine kinase [Candidatus Methylophosphatis roskildensis]MBK7235043.1 HAMP domain-containing histidine kinase [Sterolibacteriaceae bacterium]
MMSSFPPSSAARGAGSASLSRLLALRWLSIAGQIAAIAATMMMLRVDLPLAPIALAIAGQAVFNALSYARLARAANVSNAELLAQLLGDVAALTLIVYFAGGSSNPMVTLYLPLIAIAAAILPARLAAIVAAASIGGYSMLFALNSHLHVHDTELAIRVHLIGMWLTFVFSALIISWFVARMTAALRGRDAALAAAREAALRNERVVALGNLAAGAAHELGTPLATMAVLAGEFARHDSLPADAREDARLLASQVQECKRIITLLAARAGSSRAEAAQAVTLDAWLEALTARWQAQRPLAKPRVDLQGERPGPRIVPDATLDQALLNLFNNAADVSPAEVEISARWSRNVLELEVQDRGPGIPDDIARRLGHETVTTRADGHGIGLVLAFAAIERSGGTLAYAVRDGGGTCARVGLPLDPLLAS